jgi:hypothetical protein
MQPITRDKTREIVEDFVRAIRERKARDVKPATDVINFRDEKSKGFERAVESVPIELLRYRKDNGRIASDVMNYERVNGPLDERDKGAQEVLRGFLEEKHPEMKEVLIKSIEHTGQNEAAIVTCDGFLINGNRRKMALEALQKRFPGADKYRWMKVVILPGPGEAGGPPTLLEIERLENRYQLQSEGKSEYYGFDRALSITRKMALGFSLEEQLRDDPQYANVSDPELKKAVREYEKEYIHPLACVDRYLDGLDRTGMYGTISKGMSDKEGRWQAFKDYSMIHQSRLKNTQWQIEHDVDDDDLGAIEDAAFKMIRLRDLKGLPKIHQIMRKLPSMCEARESRKEVLCISNDIDTALPKNEQYDPSGAHFSPDEIDKKWAHKNQSKLIMLTKKALDYVDSSNERETPLTLLETALRKLTHEGMVVENIPISQNSEARRLAADIQKVSSAIERQLYDIEKKFKGLPSKK